MKHFTRLLAGVLILAAPLCAQETQTLVDNDQLKVELTTGLKRCRASGGLGASREGDPNYTCAVLAITNKSGVPITAWAAVASNGLPPGPHGVVGGGLSADSLSGASNKLILPGATYREAVGGAVQAEFKGAVFSDGTVFGDPEWVERIVRVRRQTYQDTIIAFQKLSDAKEAGTPREQLVREFRDLQREANKQEFGSPLSPRSRVPPTVPGFDVFRTIADELRQRPEGSDEDSLSKDIDRLELMMLDFGKRLLDSKPPITDHPVEPGQPID